jgi:hypothetical protein
MGQKVVVCDLDAVFATHNCHGKASCNVSVPDIAQDSEQEAIWEVNCSLVAHHTMGHDVRALVQRWR